MKLESVIKRGYFNFRRRFLIKGKDSWRGGPESLERETFLLADPEAEKILQKFDRITKIVTTNRRTEKVNY
jgi:hypothetical protein